MAFVGGAIGALGGLFALGITTTAAFQLINITSNQLASCKVDGYSGTKAQVVAHVKRVHGRQLQAMAARKQPMRRRPAQRRTKRAH